MSNYDRLDYNGLSYFWSKLKAKFLGKNDVSVSQNQSTGTKIGSITINGVTTDLYTGPGGGGGSTVSFNRVQSTGNKIGTITINGTDTELYTGPLPDSVSFNRVQSAGHKIGSITIGSNTTDLYTGSFVESASVNQVLSSGTNIGSITIDGVTTQLYAPTNTDTWPSTISALKYDATFIYTLIDQTKTGATIPQASGATVGLPKTIVCTNNGSRRGFSGLYSSNMNATQAVQYADTRVKSLKIKAFFSTESSAYDWGCIWAGYDTSKNAYQDHGSSVVGKLSGYSASCGQVEVTIPGNSVTIGFYSDSSNAQAGLYVEITPSVDEVGGISEDVLTDDHFVTPYWSQFKTGTNRYIDPNYFDVKVAMTAASTASIDYMWSSDFVKLCFNSAAAANVAYTLYAYIYFPGIEFLGNVNFPATRIALGTMSGTATCTLRVAPPTAANTTITVDDYGTLYTNEGEPLTYLKVKVVLAAGAITAAIATAINNIRTKTSGYTQPTIAFAMAANSDIFYGRIKKKNIHIYQNYKKFTTLILNQSNGYEPTKSLSHLYDSQVELNNSDNLGDIEYTCDASFIMPASWPLGIYVSGDQGGTYRIAAESSKPYAGSAASGEENFTVYNIMIPKRARSVPSTGQNVDQTGTNRIILAAGLGGSDGSAYRETQYMLIRAPWAINSASANIMSAACHAKINIHKF